jgi:hypothetical protein
MFFFQIKYIYINQKKKEVDKAHIKKKELIYSKTKPVCNRKKNSKCHPKHPVPRVKVKV